MFISFARRRGAAAALVVALVGGLAALPSPAGAAVTVERSTLTIPGYPKTIDLLSWSFGVSSTSSTGGSTGQPRYGDLVVKKSWDQSSPLLLTNLTTAKGLGQVTLVGAATTTNPLGKPITQYLTWTFTNTYVTSIQWGGGGDRPSESVAFSYTAVTLTYRQ